MGSQAFLDAEENLLKAQSEDRRRERAADRAKAHESFLWPLCLEEASHIIAGREAGLTPRSVFVCLNEDKTDWCGRAEFEEPERCVEPANAAVVTAAGAAARAKLRGQKNYLLGGTDHRAFWAAVKPLARRWYGSQTAGALNMAAHRCQREADRLVGENWPKIENLARHIYASHYLTGEQIEKALSGTP